MSFQSEINTDTIMMRRDRLVQLLCLVVVLLALVNGQTEDNQKGIRKFLRRKKLLPAHKTLQNPLLQQESSQCKTVL